jgi:hypothetical protein
MLRWNAATGADTAAAARATPKKRFWRRWPIPRGADASPTALKNTKAARPP